MKKTVPWWASLATDLLFLTQYIHKFACTDLPANFHAQFLPFNYSIHSTILELQNDVN
jgi:hypothetical protein